MFLADVLPKSVRWFADKDLLLWGIILKQINFKFSSVMINDCINENKDYLSLIDYSELVLLAEEVGMMDVSVGLASFQNEGLL